MARGHGLDDSTCLFATWNQSRRRGSIASLSHKRNGGQASIPPGEGAAHCLRRQLVASTSTK
eukprot:scaffold625_cov324-Pavlova_lutheri.AAC.83